jgi:hypothetical protein
MEKKSKARPYWIRLGIVLLISLVGVAIFNEVTYRMQKDDYDRSPRTIQLVIPNGTAAQVAQGQDVPSIPSEMIFVLGDKLEVVNQDVVSHQLGPIWVPAGTTGSLVMETAAKQAYSCSFQTTRYLNLDVRSGTSLGTRLAGLFLAGPATAIFMFIYSLLIFPVEKKPKTVPVHSEP